MNVEVAQRLAKLRRSKGYSQEELAESLGLSRQAVSKWERAESSPDTGNLIALAKLYGVTIDELLRVDADIEEDVKYESVDRQVSAEAQAQAAADEAAASARRAQEAASHAQAQASSGNAPPPPPQAQAYYAPPPQNTSSQSQPDQRQTQESYTKNSYNWDQNLEHSKGSWSNFPYPIICVIIYLCVGFFWGAWHPGWVVFLTVPLYYWIAHIIDNDPNNRK